MVQVKKLLEECKSEAEEIFSFVDSNKANLGSVKKELLLMYQKWYRKALLMLNIIDPDTASEFKAIYQRAEKIFGWTIVDCINRLDRPGERPAGTPQDYIQKKFMDAFLIQRSIVNSFDEDIIPEKEKEVSVRNRLFISHGKHPEVRELVCEFLESLGVEYRVVMKEPSLGKTIHNKVREVMNECTHLLALATPDEETKEGFKPRQNVIQEIGLAEKMYAGRIIIMKEKSVILPSNIRSFGYIEFLLEEIERSFIPLVKELKGFGLL